MNRESFGETGKLSYESISFEVIEVKSQDVLCVSAPPAVGVLTGGLKSYGGSAL